jgi:hypothetical protein
MGKYPKLFAGVSGILVSSSASAHVKWFAPFDTHSAPLPITEVVNDKFIVITLLLAAVLFLSYALDRFANRMQWEQVIDGYLGSARQRLPDMLRISVAIFFAALWTLEGVILTPELKTASPVIPWLQLVIALSTMFRKTLVFTGAGILALYGYAIYEYGVFHLMDYPVFIGIAVYLILTGLGCLRLLQWRMPILYASVGVTLMWAAIEKFGYPHWTHPILAAKPEITLGIDFGTYMCCAGFTEFVLAFLLISSTAFVRLVSAALLLVFTSAILGFGKVDALGHLLIIVVLAMFVIHGKSRLQDAIAAGGGSGHSLVAQSGAMVGLHFVALAGFFVAYYGFHRITV